MMSFLGNFSEIEIIVHVLLFNFIHLDCWPDMPDLPPPGEFGRHTLSLRSIIAALNARCLYSVSGGLCDSLLHMLPPLKLVKLNLNLWPNWKLLSHTNIINVDIIYKFS